MLFSRARLEALPHDIMKIGVDIKKKQSSSQRVTDPVAPAYFIDGREICDNPRDTKPAPLKKFNPDNCLLLTHDISGATAKPAEERFNSRREFRNTNFLGDISGAQADSMKHSIVTKRVTNPLNPNYPSLDNGAHLAPPVSSLIPQDFVKTPTVFHKKSNVKDGETEDVSGISSTDIISYAAKLACENDRLDGRPPPIPIDKLRIPVGPTSNLPDSRCTLSGQSSQRGSTRIVSPGESPVGSARSWLGKGTASGISPQGSSRRPSMTISERRAMEERRMEIKIVQAL